MARNDDLTQDQKASLDALSGPQKAVYERFRNHGCMHASALSVARGEAPSRDYRITVDP